MAVLVEALSVVVRLDAVTARFTGGWPGFLAVVPNNTLCFDKKLIRVGFMSPDDVGAFIDQLEMGGLRFHRGEHALDLSVVDQMRGPTLPTPWLEFARLSLSGLDQKVSACWFFEEPRAGAGIHLSGAETDLATPDGWVYEDSLSAHHQFVETK